MRGQGVRWLPGRDRRAVRHPPAAPSGTAARHPGGAPPRVAVVGGGIAGLAAATTLAEGGARVSLLEAGEQLGGRVAAWPVRLDDGSVTTMSRGFHAFFRQYYTLRSLLRRADPALTRLRPIGDYPLLAGDGTRDTFVGIPRTPPLNLVGFVAASPSFTARDLTRVDVRRALQLLRVDFPQTFTDLDGISAAQFLDDLRFPAKARHLSLEVFARSFFADPAEFSAGELVGMFHAYFVGSAEGLLFDVPDDDYDTALWSPLAGYLRRLGVDVRLGAQVQALQERGDGLRLSGGWGEIDCDAAVLATAYPGLQSLVAGADWLGTGPAPTATNWRESVARLRTAPPFAVWRLWFDRSISADAPGFLATSGRGLLDNISVLERFEAGAAQWARRTGGSVVELHAYAAPQAVTDPEATRESLLRELFRVHPELREAGVVGQEWLVRADCALTGTDPWADRPGVITPDPRVVLAGDGIRCELPVALMERAAVTGVQAGNALLGRSGRTGEPIWTVPTRGLLRRPAARR